MLQPKLPREPKLSTYSKRDPEIKCLHVAAINVKARH